MWRNPQGNCGCGHIYWKNPWWKKSFFVQCVNSTWHEFLCRILGLCFIISNQRALPIFVRLFWPPGKFCTELFKMPWKNIHATTVIQIVSMPRYCCQCYVPPDLLFIQSRRNSLHMIMRIISEEVRKIPGLGKHEFLNF